MRALTTVINDRFCCRWSDSAQVRRWSREHPQAEVIRSHYDAVPGGGFAISQAEQAYAELAINQLSGKVVLVIDERLV